MWQIGVNLKKRVKRSLAYDVWYSYRPFSGIALVSMSIYLLSVSNSRLVLMPVSFLTFVAKRYIVQQMCLKGKGKGNCIAVMEYHVTATECHLPYGITQCYLYPDTSERTPPSPQPVRPVLKKWIGSAIPGIQLWTPYTDSERHNAQRYRRTDRRTDDIMMSITDCCGTIG